MPLPEEAGKSGLCWQVWGAAAASGEIVLLRTCESIYDAVDAKRDFESQGYHGVFIKRAYNTE